MDVATELNHYAGMSSRAEQTQAARLGGGEPPASCLDLLGRGPECRWLARSTSKGSTSWARRVLGRGSPIVIRLLHKIRTATVAGRGKRPARQRYFRACRAPPRRINELFGYEFTFRPARCRIGKVPYVQPRQHAVLGHSELILEQMRRVHRTVRKWLRYEFGPVRTHRATGGPHGHGLGEWRVRSAARMYETEVAAHA